MTVHQVRAAAFTFVLVGQLCVPLAGQESALKVTAPVPQSPASGGTVTDAAPTLISTTAEGRFVPGVFDYHFEFAEIAVNGATRVLETATVVPGVNGDVAHTVQTALAHDGRYRWRVRAEFEGAVGPWSIWAIFRYVRPQTNWALLYAEDFSTPLNGQDASWVREDYSLPFDTIMDDSGLWYRNDYGPDWDTAFNSFATYRKEFTVGRDDWLTASLSARDWDKDGVIEAEPSIRIQTLGGRHAAVLDVPDHTGGAIFRPTNALPSRYRIEYKLKTIDFGGKRNGSIEYEGRVNGYSAEGCKTQHPWGEGSNSSGWAGDASVPVCEWQNVREGPYGYNGFHFLAIVDVADPAPRNNHFWHYRRKVLMDSFSQHPDRVGSGTGGRVCDTNTNSYYHYRDSSFNTVNMWISGLPEWTPGPGELAGNTQWFITECSGGVAEQQLSSAAELRPELMPNEFYVFAIERNGTGYTLEASGNFARVGQKTLRFHRPFVVDNVPIWHYNAVASEYDGRFNAALVQNDAYGSTTWSNQWPAGSAYPDYFVIGDLYTNVYEGSASLTDIRLYVPAAVQESEAEERASVDQGSANEGFDGLTGPAQGSTTMEVFTADDGTLFRVEVVATGLEAPSGLSVAPDGRVFVAERSGRIRVVEDGTLLSQPALMLSENFPAFGVGALGMALHPQFSSNGYVYLVYTVDSARGHGPVSRVVRYRELQNTLAERMVLFETELSDIPYEGPQIRFGPDGKLYVTVGDGNRTSLAQDLAEFNGKILRLNDDGTVPSDNPFSSPVFSYGHRNAQGIDWHPVSEDLWATEHGDDGYDELNVIEGGGNYGWPWAGESLTTTGMEGPILEYSSSIAPSGASFYTGSLFPTFANSFFFATLAGEHLRRVRLDPNDDRRVLDEERLLDGRFGRLRDVVDGPDGALYITTSNTDERGMSREDDDRILRLVPPQPRVLTSDHSTSRTR